MSQLPEDSPEVWKELLAHSYTGKWSNSPELLLELKDYADRYGFSCLAEECSERITALLSGEPENVMTMAAKAVAMAVSCDGAHAANAPLLPAPDTAHATHCRAFPSPHWLDPDLHTPRSRCCSRPDKPSTAQQLPVLLRLRLCRTL